MPNTVSVIINDQIVELIKLTPRENMALVSRIWTAGRTKLLQDLNDAQAGPDLRQQRLEAWRAREGDMTLLVDRIKSIEGQDEVLAVSLKKTVTAPTPKDFEKACDPSAIDMELIDRMKLVGQLCGFRWSESTGGTGEDPDDGLVREHPQEATGGSGSSKPA